METKSLIEIRKEKGLNQQDLAKLAGVSQSTLSYIERAVHKPQKRIRRDIAAALDVLEEEIEEFN